MIINPNHTPRPSSDSDSKNETKERPQEITVRLKIKSERRMSSFSLRFPLGGLGELNI